MRHIYLSLIWIAWCAIHSAMISITVTTYLKRKLGSLFRFYRLFFNITACVTFIPVICISHAVSTQPIFIWSGYGRIVQAAFIIISLTFFISGLAHYDMSRLSGIRQAMEGLPEQQHGTINLNTSGILGITRHPWYLASIIIIWSLNMSAPDIIRNIILTAYFIIGTFLEERKLVLEFGDRYREYQQTVSMLFPWKWIKKRLT